jgi:exodeoxyribonuclease VII small subunit
LGDALTFDQAMLEAEQLLSQMESGELELEDALRAYERGNALLARCKAVLAQAQQRVELIAAQSAAPTSTPPASATDDEA